MKYTFFLLVSVMIIGQLCGQSELPHICKMHQLEVEDMESGRNLARQNFVANVLTSDYNILYHRIHWTVDPEVNFIEGRILTNFVPLKEDFQKIHFDFSDSLLVLDVRYHDVSVPFEQISGHTLSADLPPGILEGVLDSIEVWYEGVPKPSGFSSFNVGKHGDSPLLWTLSQPYGARDWWPCKQDLNDKIDSVDIYVTTPVAYKVASNGVLDTIVDQGTSHTYVWKHRYPIAAYLIAIGVTDYEVFTQYAPLPNGDSVAILNYIYPEDVDRVMDEVKITEDLITFFSEKFGDYPFADEKYGHAQFGFGGGMEHQTMSFMGGFSFNLQAHELAHQWFGDKVTCGSWQDIWLNEGFATYLAAMGYERFMPQLWYGWKDGNIKRVTGAPDGSVYVHDTTSIGRIFNGRLTYTKGALVLHMLRWKLGEDAFFKACRDFVNDPELAFGYARTGDLTRVFEMSSGVPIREFIQDWVYGEGHPSYFLRWEHKDGRLYLRLDQTTSHPSVDFYEMPIPVQVYSEGRDTTLRLEHEYSGQLWNLPWEEAVDSIVFDRDRWILSSDNVVSNEPLTHTLEVTDVLSVHPNPMKEVLYLNLKNGKEASIEIRSLDGRRHPVRTTLAGSGIIDVQSWPAGVYILSVTQGGQTGHIELIKS